MLYKLTNSSLGEDDFTTSDCRKSDFKILMKATKKVIKQYSMYGGYNVIMSPLSHIATHSLHVCTASTRRAMNKLLFAELANTWRHVSCTYMDSIDIYTQWMTLFDWRLTAHQHRKAINAKNRPMTQIFNRHIKIDSV